MKYKNKFVMALVSGLTFYTIAVNAQPSGDISITDHADIYIKAKHSNKCLHIQGGAQDNGLLATQWDCIRQNNVIWKLSPAPNDPGFYFIQVKSSDKCLQVNDSSPANGARISQWDCVDQPNVKWNFFPAGDGYYYIRAKHSNKCFQVNNLSQANNAAITQWDCVNQPNVHWKFENAN
jgi:hypothetical protein